MFKNMKVRVPVPYYNKNVLISRISEKLEGNNYNVYKDDISKIRFYKRSKDIYLNYRYLFYKLDIINKGRIFILEEYNKTSLVCSVETSISFFAVLLFFFLIIFCLFFLLLEIKLNILFLVYLSLVILIYFSYYLRIKCFLYSLF